MGRLREYAVLAGGLALFWPFFSFTAFPALFCLGAVASKVPPTSPVVDGAQGVLIFLAALVAVRMSTRALRGVLAITVALVVVAAVGVALWDGTIAVAAANAVVLAAGVCTGLLMVAWSRSVGECASGRLAGLLAFSYFLSFVARHAVDALCLSLRAPDGLSHTIIALMPLASGVLWAISAGASARVPVARGIGRSSSCAFSGKALFADPYAKMGIAAGLYLVASFFFGFVGDGTDLKTTTWLTKIMALLFTFAMFLIAWRSSESERRGACLWAAFVGVCIGASYFVAFFGSTAPDLARQIVLPTRVCALFFAWFAACECARREGIRCDVAVLVLFAPLVAVDFVLSAFLPVAAVARIGAAYAGMAVFLCALPSTLLLVWALVDLVRRTPDSAECDGLPIAGETRVDRTGTERERRGRVCAELGERYGLTARECEVMCLLSEGNSQKRIAEMLFIAVSSSQTYSKSIYRKMGLHSRQEVIDVVNARMKGQGE